MFKTPTISNKTAIYRGRKSPIELIDKPIHLVPKGDGFGVKDNEILIKTAAVALNPWDAILRTLGFSLWGFRGPFELGFDYSGVVADIGTEMAAKYNLKVGDKVCGQTDCSGSMFSMKEYQRFALPNNNHGFSIIKVPKNLTMVEAASFPVVYSTAVHAIDSSSFGDSPRKMLVCGASTSVGKYLVQLLKMDPRVDELVGICSKKSEPIVKELGVDTVIDYNATANIFETVMDHCRDRKFQCYFDCTGNEALLARIGDFIEEGGSSASTAGGKKYELSDASIAIRYLNFNYLKNLIYSKFNWSPFSAFQVLVEAGRGFDKVTELFEQNKIKPFVHSVYSYKDIQKAFDVLVEGKNNGKIVVEMN